MMLSNPLADPKVPPPAPTSGPGAPPQPALYQDLLLMSCRETRRREIASEERQDKGSLCLEPNRIFPLTSLEQKASALGKTGQNSAYAQAGAEEVGMFKARGWELHPTFPPAPPAGPTTDQLGTLEQFLVSHQTEMKCLLSGALGSLSQRLESVERRMEQLHAQSSAHGGSLALLHSKVNSLRKNLCTGCSNALPTQSMGSSYTYEKGSDEPKEDREISVGSSQDSSSINCTVGPEGSTNTMHAKTVSSVFSPNPDTQGLCPLGLSGGSSGLEETSSGQMQENYLPVLDFQDLQTELEDKKKEIALKSLGGSVLSKLSKSVCQMPPCSSKLSKALSSSPEDLNPGPPCPCDEQYTTTGLWLQTWGQSSPPSFTAEVFGGLQEITKCESAGPLVTKTHLNTKHLNENRSLCLAQTTHSPSEQFGAQPVTDKLQACSGPLVTSLPSGEQETTGRPRRVKNDISEGVVHSGPTLFKTFSQGMSPSGEVLLACVEDKPVRGSSSASAEQGPKEHGKRSGEKSEDMSLQNSLRNGSVPCVRLEVPAHSKSTDLVPYSCRMSVTPSQSLVNSYQTSGRLLLPQINLKLAIPKNGSTNLRQPRILPNCSTGERLNELSRIACHLMSLSSSTSTVSSQTGFRRTVSKLKQHRGVNHSSQSWPPQKAGEALSPAFPELQTETSTPWRPLEMLGDPHSSALVRTSRSPSLHNLLNGGAGPYLTLTQLFRSAACFPMFVLNKGHFCGAGLGTALAVSSPASFRLWFRRRRLSCPLTTFSPSSVSKVLRQLVVQSECRPPRPLVDYTGPPGLDNDHCYAQQSSQEASPSMKRASERKLSSSPSPRRLQTHLTSERNSVLPAQQSSSPKCAGPSDAVQNFAIIGANVKYPCLHSQGVSRKTEQMGLYGLETPAQSGHHSKRVSQIRIRKTVPKPDNNLTPMGLPKPKRLKKKEFSLEEIYTNKNYKSPTPNRSLETIFEEPKEKNGTLVCIGHQKRKRILDFPDFTLPRKRKAKTHLGSLRVKGPRGRARRGTSEDADLDVMLIERLSELEDFFSRQGLED